jgi:hypothetical protein
MEKLGFVILLIEVTNMSSSVFNEETIDSLLARKPIVKMSPWVSQNDYEIEEFYKKIITEITVKFSLLDETEYDNYGSGYGSYIDCFLYRKDDNFRFGNGESFNGLNILLSRLSNYYALGSTWHSWRGKHKASGSMPHLDSIDNFKETPIIELVNPVSSVLEKYGLVRLEKQQLSELLHPGKFVPTILSDPPWYYFDALFYWED